MRTAARAAPWDGAGEKIAAGGADRHFIGERETPERFRLPVLGQAAYFALARHIIAEMVLANLFNFVQFGIYFGFARVRLAAKGARSWGNRSGLG
jgi:hypothetical protein